MDLKTINGRKTILKYGRGSLKTALSDAIRKGISLAGADLIGADLSWADLSWANLIGANLTDAHLEGANLQGVKLYRTILDAANF